MRKLSFCLGSSCRAAAWHPVQMTLEELWDRLETPIRTPETVAQYHKMKKGEKDAIILGPTSLSMFFWSP